MGGQKKDTYGDNVGDRSAADVEGRDCPEGSGPETAAEDRGDERSRGPDADNNRSAVERPSNTQLLSSQINLPQINLPCTTNTNLPLSQISFLPPHNPPTPPPEFSPALPDGIQVVTSIDWLTTAGMIAWDAMSELEFQGLERAYREAYQLKQPQPYTLAGCPLFVHSTGMGTGKQSRLNYRLNWAGVTIGFADRPAPKRNQYNFQLQVPGKPCLLIGAREARQKALDMIGELNGSLMEEWVRRVDICIDVVGLDLKEELLPAFNEKRFVTSATTWNSYDGKDGTTGFSMGSSSRVRLNVYDKRHEASTKQSNDYLRGMIDRRWGGELPKQATRIEFQIQKQWLDGYGYRDADSVLVGLPDIMHKLTGDGSRAFVRFTESMVDRENKHQSRAETLPVWRNIIKEAQRQLGEPQHELKPIQRGSISNKRSHRVIRGLLTQLAATRGEAIENFDDALEQLRKLEAMEGDGDEAWADTWERKAREAGTLDAVTDFSPETF